MTQRNKEQKAKEFKNFIIDSVINGILITGVVLSLVKALSIYSLMG